jgi:hypothetical protein
MGFHGERLSIAIAQSLVQLYRLSPARVEERGQDVNQELTVSLEFTQHRFEPHRGIIMAGLTPAFLATRRAAGRGCFQVVHLRHAYVHEDKVVAGGLKNLDSLSSILSSSVAVAGNPQMSHDNRPARQEVIGRENAERFLPLSCSFI